jgi:hypothetical protein
MRKEVEMLLAEEIGETQATNESEFIKDPSKDEKTITPSKTNWSSE